MTQNVGGIRTECKKRGGPKFGTIRKLVSPTTDFVILTETKALPSKIQKCKLKYGLRPSLFTTLEAARGGVAIFSHPTHELVAGSTRISTPDGHYALAVYIVKGIKVIVGGVYGCPENNDPLSAAIITSLKADISELKFLHNTSFVIVGGDFNCVLSVADTSSNRVLKHQASAALHDLIAEHDLLDLANSNNSKKHTWFRRGDTESSSRIDYIFTNIRAENTKFSTHLTIFDHTCLSVKIAPSPFSKNSTMKDYILSSDQFLIQSSEIIQQILAPLGIPTELAPPPLTSCKVRGRKRGKIPPSTRSPSLQQSQSKGL